MAQFESGYSDIHCQACAARKGSTCDNKTSHKFGKVVQATSYCVKGIIPLYPRRNALKRTFEEEIAARKRGGITPNWG